MKFKKIESEPETTTFGSLPTGTTFSFGEGVILYKTQLVTFSGAYVNTLRLYDAQFLITEDAEPVEVVECVLEFKVVR